MYIWSKISTGCLFWEENHYSKLINANKTSLEDIFLTHSVAEGRSDDFRLSGLSKVKISRIEFFDPKWLYPSKRLLQQMNLSDCPSKIFGPRKNHFSLAVLRILTKNRILAPPKILKCG